MFMNSCIWRLRRFMIQDVEKILKVTELGNSETGDQKSMGGQ